MNFRKFTPRSAVFYFILLSVVISIIGFISWAIDESYIAYFALRPSFILSGQYLWTLVLHMFTHGNPIHLFVNMFVLFSLGTLCERIIGKKRFIWFYLISGLIAGILSVLMTYLFGYGLGESIFGSPDEFMVGASGAIFAIAGFIMIILPKLKFSIIFLPFFSLPAYLMIPVVLIFTWVLSIAAGWNVGNVAHFGGFLAGLFYGLYLKSRYERKIKLIQKYFR